MTTPQTRSVFLDFSTWLLANVTQSYHPQTASCSTPDPTRSEEDDSSVLPTPEDRDTTNSAAMDIPSEEPDPGLTSMTGRAPMGDTVSCHRPFKKPKLSAEPSISHEQSLTGRSIDLPSAQSTSISKSSKISSDPAHDAELFSNLYSLIDTIRARSAVAEAEKEQSRALFKAATGRANRRANVVE